MKQISSTTFGYHQRNYELVKFGESDFVQWEVFNYSIEGRGDKVFSFTDARFTTTQAEHMAKHCLLNYGAGVIEGRRQIKQEVKDLIT
ncbi:MAG: hypothetical protein LC650_05480 [Actinobacteria bacterium]|nr:hypothetical protein [Actinomycetota bacterium]